MTDLVERLRRRAEAMDALGSSDLSDAARATTAWQIESAATLFHAANDSVEAADEIERLQKEIETAREDALEEAIAEASVLADRKYSFDTHMAAVQIMTAIRSLKDKEVAG